jgi:hypothetical protein
MRSEFSGFSQASVPIVRPPRTLPHSWNHCSLAIGVGYCTVRLTVAVAVMVPDVPVTVIT